MQKTAITLKTLEQQARNPRRGHWDVATPFPSRNGESSISTHTQNDHTPERMAELQNLILEGCNVRFIMA